jgi:FkbM family methyltransferase
MSEAEPAALGFIRQYSIVPRGVIYAGAYDGELVDHFLGLGFKDLLAIEPNPTPFAELVKRASEHLRCVPLALSDRRGKVPYFNVEQAPAFNSIYEPDRDLFAADYGKELVDSLTVTRLEFECDTLDAIVGSSGALYNGLYMNMQGAEPVALRGAEETLQRLDAIHTEVNFDQRYRGCTMYEELDQFLTARDFVQVHLWKGSGFGMASYVHRRILAARPS